MTKRKVFVPVEPHRPLTVDECRELLVEAERYRDKMAARLEALDQITTDDWRIRIG